MKKFIFALMLAAVWGGEVSAQSSQESLKEYVPVLPRSKGEFWKIDPKLGYRGQKCWWRRLHHIGQRVAIRIPASPMKASLF